MTPPASGNGHRKTLAMAEPAPPRPKRSAAEDAVVQLLVELGEDPKRPGLEDTPGRYVRALAEMTSGTGQDAAEILSRTFDAEKAGPVLVRGIEFASLCEHHILPFSGRVTVAYEPDGRIVGLSKLSRLVQAFSRRLQVQERLTDQIADAIADHLAPRGVAVLVEGRHTCMSLRGVRTAAPMVTTAFRGSYGDGAKRSEFLTMASTRQSGHV